MEGQRWVLEKKRAAYREYKDAREEMKTYSIAKRDVSMILELDKKDGQRSETRETEL